MDLHFLFSFHFQQYLPPEKRVVCLSLFLNDVLVLRENVVGGAGDVAGMEDVDDVIVVAVG